MNMLVTFLAEGVCKAGNWIIFIFAIINGVLFAWTKVAICRAEKIFNPRNDKVNGVSASMDWDNEEIAKVKKVRKGLIIKYTWYANFTEIFPFLGILGTVAALVTYSDVTMMENFMVALSTTLLGVIFAAVFKGIDAILSGPMDVIIEDADHVIQEHERSERKRNAA